MINLIWLKTFCSLVDIGHFTQTAEKLFMTQSGVSQHIKKLEQQLDTLLLVREGKSFSLTDAGDKLYQQGQVLLKTSEEIESSIKHDDPLIGTVKITTPGSVGLKLYSQLLEVQQRHPTLVIDYMFAPNSSIEQDLTDRKVDIGLLTEQTKSATLLSTSIAVEPLVLVTSKEIEVINWPTLIALGFIDHPDAEHHAQQLLSENYGEFEHITQFERTGFSNQISLILEPVSRGLGFTVLPLHAVNAFHKQDDIAVHFLKHTVNETLYLCQNRLSFENSRTQYIKSLIIDLIS
ncbi:LysR family transcriptional regulator [Colwellia psychrerythraea]|uniref:Transcriptional regulator, LysR family n=1 Tax=Colwellia psychrerythraea TaxID=28229 RepID=A0A099KCJ7_COLPS|nr:LysR family transcriptional regulator [Colwellia psychrerythraea]KGJ88459.1 transcriptional regulator, LysR family [Colwellia psychrerythraea]